MFIFQHYLPASSLNPYSFTYSLRYWSYRLNFLDFNFLIAKLGVIIIFNPMT